VRAEVVMNSGVVAHVFLTTDDGRTNVRAATTTVRVTTPLRVSATTTALARTA